MMSYQYAKLVESKWVDQCIIKAKTRKEAKAVLEGEFTKEQIMKGGIWRLRRIE